MTVVPHRLSALQYRVTSDHRIIILQLHLLLSSQIFMRKSYLGIGRAGTGTRRTAHGRHVRALGGFPRLRAASSRCLGQTSPLPEHVLNRGKPRAVTHVGNTLLPMTFLSWKVTVWALKRSRRKETSFLLVSCPGHPLLGIGAGM